MAKLPIDILKEARAYLAKPGAWVQHAGSVEAGTACTVTAIHRVTGEYTNNEYIAEDALRAAMKKLKIDSGYPSIYNDEIGRTVEDILALYDEAIKIEKTRNWWEVFFLGLGLDFLATRTR